MSCGIPRETARRKLNMLVEKGWVTRDERGVITAANKAKTDLAPLTQASSCQGSVSSLHAYAAGGATSPRQATSHRRPSWASALL
jgi:DeoR/GlpR family transcriptional regulator of sugar metabolism